MKTSFAFFLVIGFIVGCSGSEAGPGSGQGSLATAARFCDAWAQAACNDAVVDACTADDTPSCVASQKAFCLDLLPFGYDPKYAQECIDAVADAYADADLSAEELGVVLNLAAPCDRLIKGISEADGACSTDTDCNTLEGLKCVVKADGSGTCQVPVEVGGGQKCSGADQVCAPGFYCGSGNCIAYKELEEACESDLECQPEHRCTAVSSTEGTTPGECVARADDGEDCTSDAECASRLCAVARGSTEGVCVSEVRLSAAIPFCRDLR